MFVSFSFSRNCRHACTIPRRGRQTLCRQQQSGEIRSETLIKIVNATTCNQLRHLLDQFGVKSSHPSLLGSPLSAHTSPSSSSAAALYRTKEFGRPVQNSASSSAVIDTLFSPLPPPPLLLEQTNHYYCLHKRQTPLSTVHSKATTNDQIAAVAPATNNRRTKNHSSDGNETNTNCISTSDDIDWYIQLASKCYTDGFLSHIKHLDECTRPHRTITIDNHTKLQRQQSLQQQQQHVKTHPSSPAVRQRQRRIHRPLKPLRSTNLFSSSSRASCSTSTNWCDSFKIGDSHRINRRCHRRCINHLTTSTTETDTGTGVADHSVIDRADGTMNGGLVIDANLAQQTLLQQQQLEQSNACIDDQNNRFVYGCDDRMNVSPTTANRVNDLINSFYTLNLSTADDYTLPQIILTDFSNNSLQPTTTPLFSSSSTTTTEQPEMKSQPQFTFSNAHFSASSPPNHYQLDSNESRSFNSN